MAKFCFFFKKKEEMTNSSYCPEPQYQPELVLVSAGFDAALGCPEVLRFLTIYSHTIYVSYSSRRNWLLFLRGLIQH